LFVAIGRFDLRIAGSASLKDKRAVLRGLISMARQKFNCSVAEIDHQDLWQRAALGISVVSETQFHARRVLHEIERHVQTHPGVELLGTTLDIVAPGD
jgi:uncharacterized protein